MIKINLVREGRAVRGAGAAPGVAAVAAANSPKARFLFMIHLSSRRFGQISMEHVSVHTESV